MTTSREIKKALNRAFKCVKFSVTTRNVLCETITVKWTGYPFILHVKEITDQWNTFENHSDSLSDYFNYTGVRIEFERLLSDEEKENVVPMILKMHGIEAQDGKKSNLRKMSTVATSLIFLLLIMPATGTTKH